MRRVRPQHASGHHYLQGATVTARLSLYLGVLLEKCICCIKLAYHSRRWAAITRRLLKQFERCKMKVLGTGFLECALDDFDGASEVKPLDFEFRCDGF